MELIIDKLGSRQDKANLSSYEEEFSEYARRRAFECPPEIGITSDGTVALLFVTLDENYKSCTVSSLQLLVRKLAEVLKLSSDAGLKLCQIELG